jgi:nitrate reductase NapE component
MTSTTNRLIVSILGGEIVTLLTGLFPNTPEMLVGAVYYGFPIAWLFRMIVAPEYNPWRIDFLKFLADVVVWSVIFLVIVFILEKTGKPASK